MLGRYTTGPRPVADDSRDPLAPPAIDGARARPGLGGAATVIPAA